MKHGAFDFIEKPFSLQAILTRVEEAISVNASQWRARASTHAIEQMLMSLTPREREVLVRIGLGMNSKVIARELGVSTRTVEYHRGKIRRKLGTTTQNDLSRFAPRLPDRPVRDCDRPGSRKFASAGQSPLVENHRLPGAVRGRRRQTDIVQVSSTHPSRIAACL